MSERTYPLPAPESDARFTFGLIHDIKTRLEAAGYPPIRGGDFIELQQALYRFLYEVPVLSGEELAAVAVRVELCGHEACPQPGTTKTDDGLFCPDHLRDYIVADDARTLAAQYGYGEVAVVSVERVPARGHGHDVLHACPPIGAGKTPRCGASGPTALFASDVTCQECRSLMKQQARDAGEPGFFGDADEDFEFAPTSAEDYAAEQTAPDRAGSCDHADTPCPFGPHDSVTTNPPTTEEAP